MRPLIRPLSGSARSVIGFPFCPAELTFVAHFVRVVQLSTPGAISRCLVDRRIFDDYDPGANVPKF